ncbi:MAG TPA: methyltransferase domain-containing protein [Xanthobacteraceae bacterium]|jgi:2-polyprenyl-3-methyl-5-hydroxy-6-metoxy-1,4-benzoquinol methylase|nr:methyltransferase domain-containing protein [Xanthobacteraceae bacterium]
MNRRDRRVATARGKAAVSGAPAEIAGLLANASRAHHEGRSAQAETFCKQILSRAPTHTAALNMLGLVHQAAGRHRLAIRMFAKAIAVDDLDAACHFNIAASHQFMGQRADATEHYRQAIALGLSGQNAEEFLTQSPVITECVRLALEDSRSLVKKETLFSVRDIAAVANDIFLRCALQLTIIRGAPLELFLTQIRAALLRLSHGAYLASAKVDDEVIEMFCAVAQQCFITEYVFAQSEREMQQAGDLRKALLQKLSAGNDISPLLLAAVGAYFPLHSLAGAKLLLDGQWPQCAIDLMRQQIREPLHEAEERSAIAALTAVDDATSKQVMEQYEENPYPRWTVNPHAVLAGEMKRHAVAAEDASRPRQEILIAGCGTGRHAFDVALETPDARILAIDISRASLAYAQRKTHEEGLANIEYAQADILKLAAIGRSFDRIESVGVLHHLADPKAGWRILLSLLKPHGVMRIGLYSEIARRSVVEARRIIAERGYLATADHIRELRQLLIHNRDEPRWQKLITTVDFHNMSGCRDMLFNVMEHRFTIPDIEAFLNEQNLSFLGFDLDAKIIEKFQQQFPGAAAPTNLDYWNTFETANPQTFRHMYVFSVCKNQYGYARPPVP